MSPINVLIGEVLDQPEVVEANFIHQIPSDEYSTYPIKTSNLAFEELKKNKAYIASSPQNGKISIKNITLGYYIGEKEQDYLVPIIVFEGNGFEAFVSAVTDEWTNK